MRIKEWLLGRLRHEIKDAYRQRDDAREALDRAIGRNKNLSAQLEYAIKSIGELSKENERLRAMLGIANEEE